MKTPPSRIIIVTFCRPPVSILQAGTVIPEQGFEMEDKREFSPSFERNIGPISQILTGTLPKEPGHVLEIGSGSGQHVTHLAQKFPRHSFQPSEHPVSSLASIDAWREHYQLSNVQPAVHLDVTKDKWGFSQNRYAAILAFNVIHYAPWAVTPALFMNALPFLRPGGKVVLYGPYRKDGVHTAPSNATFEEWLKSKNSEFGVRDIGEVEEVAEKAGYRLEALHNMPANNFMPVFVRL
jgi:cyclopropane fatty-acyl-phospholipid synthase-like methyltransferase